MASFRSEKSLFSLICAWLALNVRDFFIFGGLFLLGYGLFLYIPWVSYAICGLILMLLGLGWLTRGHK